MFWTQNTLHAVRTTVFRVQKNVLFPSLPEGGREPPLPHFW
jgi:hypothetical protein